MEKNINVIGARVNNLQNIDVTIPRNSLVVITGLSGSGKSSLAFDTIYAEGQRRYMETLSSYARQFVGNMERPEVDNITGLGPVISIEQKTTNKNPRSTVGTVTEINDFLRLLYARASTAFSPITGQQMHHSSDQSIVDLITASYKDSKIALLAPMVNGRKGHYRELFDEFMRKGYLYARIDGQITEIYSGMRLDRYKIHNIELVVDRLVVNGDQDDDRLMKSLKETLRQGKGMAMVHDYETGSSRYYSRNLMCPQSGMAISDPAPHTFSFNSPQGACPHCGGLGDEAVFDRERIMPNTKKSIAEGAVEPLGKHKNNLLFATLAALGKRYDFDLKDPVDTLSDEAINAVLNGESESFTINTSAYGGSGNNIIVSWDGVGEYIDRMEEDSSSTKGSKWKEQFVTRKVCSVCKGSRLRAESLYFRFDNKTIAELSEMSISSLLEWLDGVEDRISERQRTIAVEILKEIRERLGFLVDVGLGYLSLSRSSRTLSGGESQRIRLATQIGSKLINVLYILDEPSIGLHQDDNHRLIESLKSLRDAGNSIIVVEHDDEMIRNADWVVDVGPGAGRFGGQITASGTYEDILKTNSITAEFMSGRRKIEVPENLRKGSDKFITIKGARGHNLKNINLGFPLSKMICVTGMSGSGKSSLINDTLRPIISRELYRSYEVPLEYDSIEGIENIDKMVVVDQAPIGRSPRSNPATYTGVFGDIRKLFESTPDAQIRGFKAGRFSFNVKGGRCEECRGAGVKTIEMNFLPDIYVRCNVCDGKRYNNQTLEVKYKGHNINQVLDMTINQAAELFAPIPNIYIKLKAVQDVGLGYLKLGQPCTTLSGGESQRIKLSTELSRRDTGNTLYILDEPTTGLHFEDIRVLMNVLNQLADKGNTVLIIEHNMDVIKAVDHIIDIGPEGGAQGGYIIAEGTPEQVAQNPRSRTGAWLKKIYNI